jgi:hypothetical protein
MLSMSQDQISELLLLIGRSAQFVFKIPLFYGGVGGSGQKAILAPMHL